MEPKQNTEAVTQEMPSREQMIADLRSASAPSRAPASVPSKPSREQMLADLRKEESLSSQVEAIGQRKKQELAARPAKAPEKKAAPTQEKPNKFLTKNDIIRYLFDTDKMAGLTPGTSAAMVDVESKFDPKAVSKKGAKGIAQIMPKTMRSLSGRFKRLLDPFNVADALFMHREIMKENMNHFQSEADAITAYNAGWNKKAFTRTKEAREYLPKVLRARESYPSAPEEDQPELGQSRPA